MRSTRAKAPGPRGAPSLRTRFSVVLRTTSLPICRTRSTPGGTGVVRNGAIGGPFLPQPAASSPVPSAARAHAARRRRRPAPRTMELEDVTAEILILDDVGEHPVDIGPIDGDLSLRHVRR